MFSCVDTFLREKAAAKAHTKWKAEVRIWSFNAKQIWPEGLIARTHRTDCALRAFDG